MSVITVDDLTVRYEQHTALSHVNFTVEEKEFIGIIGPNGGGKTTLIKAILGLKKIDEGRIVVDAKEVVGYVPQVSTFDKGFPISVMDVILTGHLPKKIKFGHRFKGHDESHALRVMTQLGIDGLASRQIGQLSGGQMQRVLIARALMNHPTVLVLDEPTASVDQGTKVDIYEMLKSLNKVITIIIITHDTTQMWPYLDRCIYINKTAHLHNHEGEAEGDALDVCPIDWFIEGEKIQKALTEGTGRNDTKHSSI